ncbi:unnamed protein product [Caenorhabditis bovis]|uniref:DUF19 domain-containing protein n=1 Tax=Caenorhabditis bovis TaxID=2654633 RepID=A0A8S1EVY9_9PELO|nr:unnamed protein product [Caenorhabditis bovis]
MLLYSLLLAFIPLSQTAKFLDQVSKQAIQVLHGSQRDGIVRQCTCNEMKDCYASSKAQALDCFETCWKQEIQHYKITDNPTSLKACFDAKKPFVDNVIDCFQKKVKACAEDESQMNKQVREYDYNDMIKRVEDAVNAQINSFMKSIGNENVKQVVNAGKAIALCVKNCFIEKNKDGFCFNRIGCEPQIEDKNAKAAIRQCSRAVQWKKEMEQFCKCSSAAGITGLSSYCGMLNIIGK